MSESWVCFLYNVFGIDRESSFIVWWCTHEPNNTDCTMTSEALRFYRWERHELCVRGKRVHCAYDGALRLASRIWWALKLSILISFGGSAQYSRTTYASVRVIWYLMEEIFQYEKSSTCRNSTIKEFWDRQVILAASNLIGLTRSSIGSTASYRFDPQFKNQAIRTIKI